jgi:hypothetical protein
VRSWQKQQGPARSRFHAEGESLRYFGDAVRGLLGLAPLYIPPPTFLKEERETRAFYRTQAW